jgi:iron(III) transport system permease protein
VSAAAAVVAVAASIPVAVWAVRYPSRVARVIARLSYSGYALPGLVIALSLVFLVTRHFRGMYQTLGLLIVAYCIRFLPEALSATRSALAAVAPAFEEAARSLGDGTWRVLRAITLPLIRSGLLAGAGLVFLTSMKELPATLILRPIGFETLATRIWSAASEGVFSEAAAPSLMLLVASAVPVWMLIIRPALSGRGA